MEQKVVLAVEDEGLRHVHRRHSCRYGRAVPVEYLQEYVLLEKVGHESHGHQHRS